MVTIKFAIGRQLANGKICVHGAGSGIYTVNTEEDYEYFPIPAGLVKIKLPDDFDVEDFCNDFVPEANDYDSAIDHRSGRKTKLTREEKIEHGWHKYTIPTKEVNLHREVEGEAITSPTK